MKNTTFRKLDLLKLRFRIEVILWKLFDVSTLSMNVNKGVSKRNFPPYILYIQIGKNWHWVLLKKCVTFYMYLPAVYAFAIERTEATCHGDNRDFYIGFGIEYFVGIVTVLVISFGRNRWDLFECWMGRNYRYLQSQLKMLHISSYSA
jgi:hypothetical protein